MRRGRIAKRGRAFRDLDEIASYIARDNRRAAARFLNAAERTFQLLATHPELGRTFDAVSPRAAGVRRFGVSGFESYLIFYVPLPDGIDVLGIVHGARDLAAWLEREK